MRTAATGIRRSATSAQVINPVSPSPPSVAWKSRSSGPISLACPSERSSSRRRTCAPNVPARWWFLPWMSLAIAPPTDTCLVPGTTGRKKPRGTISRRISPRSGKRLREHGTLRRADADDAGRGEKPQDLPAGIHLEPARGEVRARAPLVMVVLEQLAHGEEVEGQRVAAFVPIVEVLIPVLVAGPIHDRAVHWSQHEVEGQHEGDLPPVRGKREVEERIHRPEGDARRP